MTDRLVATAVMVLAAPIALTLVAVGVVLGAWGRLVRK